MQRTAEEQMRLMESICLHTTHALELYGLCLMEAETYDPEILLTDPAILAVANALARSDGTQGAPTDESPTLDDITFHAESERIAQQDIMDLYAAFHVGQHAPGVKSITVSPVPEAGPVNAPTALETMKLIQDEEQIMSLAPVLRAPSVVVSGPDTVRSEAMGGVTLHPVPRRSRRSQTPRRGRGRGRNS